MTPSHGATFHKVDLHTHTPASSDYRDKSATAADIIAAATSAGITILAITDHNSADWINKVRDASKGTGVTVIPGVEITTPEGHILALFDVDRLASDIQDLLVAVGLARPLHGKEEAISKEHAEDVIKAIDAAGGLAIAAHANSKGIGLLSGKGQYKIQTVPMPQLAALELTTEKEITAFSTGTVSADYAAKPCTQSSDSHALSEIGQRFCYLKVDSPSLNGLRQALLDHEVRVRFPWNMIASDHARIVSLSVDQGFFAGEEFEFHEGLNCMVGGKGTGKSTTIELLRYCFGDQSSFAHIKEDHIGKIDTLVGVGGTVTVVYQDSDGQTKTISRTVRDWEEDRQVVDQAGNVATIVSPPAFFSQGELVDVARSPLAQIELIDRQLNLDGDNARESQLITQLKKNAAAIVVEETKARDLEAEIDHPEKGRAATAAIHATLEKNLGDPLLVEFPRLEAEQQYLKGLDDALLELPDLFNDITDEIDLETLALAIPDSSPHKTELTKLAGVAKDVAKAIADSQKSFLATITKARTKVKDVSKALAPDFSSKKKAHGALLTTIKQPDKLKADTLFRNLATRLETFGQKAAELKTRREKFATLQAERKALVVALAEVRKARAEKRATKGAEYQSKLKGIVTITLTPRGDRKDFFLAMREVSKGAQIKDLDLQKIVAKIDPSALVSLIKAQDVQGIVGATGTTKEIAGRLTTHALQKESKLLSDVECVALPDMPEIAYGVGGSRYKALGELSTGQKGTVIIAIAMVDGAGPLVIDHPEEPLDTTAIYEQVVTTLRAGKDTRQFVFTTHNANVAVGADADLSHILGATADKGTIESRGGIEHEGTNRLLLLHLEGGPDAMKRRIRKYGNKVS